jgi:hypothetical protein
MEANAASALLEARIRLLLISVLVGRYPSAQPGEGERVTVLDCPMSSLEPFEMTRCTELGVFSQSPTLGTVGRRRTSQSSPWQPRTRLVSPTRELTPSFL